MRRDEVQGLIALHCRLAQMSGHKMDKAAMRFSAMTDYVEHLAACGCKRPSIYPMEWLWEAVETAIQGSPMHIPGQPFNRAAYRWMEEAA